MNKIKKLFGYTQIAGPAEAAFVLRWNLPFFPPCVALLSCIIFLSCNGKKESTTLFTEVPASHSHINFSNTIEENEDYNIDTYEYLYNGGGVATADLNNDGLPDIVLAATCRRIRYT
jgi:hypothetical protein